MAKKKLKLEPKWLDDGLARAMLADSLALAATQRNINIDYDMEERIRKLEERFQKEVRKEHREKQKKSRKRKTQLKKLRKSKPKKKKLKTKKQTKRKR